MFHDMIPTHPCTCGILRSNPLFFNIGIVGGQCLLKKGHLVTTCP